MQYTVSMSTRMLAVASFCAFLLCVLLFLLGIELGKRFADPYVAPATLAPAAAALPPAAAPALPPLPAAPAVPAAPAAPAATSFLAKP